MAGNAVLHTIVQGCYGCVTRTPLLPPQRGTQHIKRYCSVLDLRLLHCLFDSIGSIPALWRVLCCVSAARAFLRLRMVSWSILSHSSGRHKRLLLPHALRAASMSVGARACVLLLILVLLLYPAQTQQTNLSSSNDSCLANDGYGMQACLANASSNRILLKQPVYMNLTTSPAEQGPIIINRSIVISSEAR